MSRLTSLQSPFLLGFDGLERALERVARSGDGYPPYNIERLPAADGQPERLRITLAVAGFRPEQIEVSISDNELVIRGRPPAERPDRDFLHRGIAARQFARAFLLADGMEVLGAELATGLLVVDLVRPEPNRSVRRIAIASRDETCRIAEKE
ncbi:heat-shock protein Hsp20 [Methylopila jiangsuensis]|uniref:Heat-shock protein Hsp20 n=1 Tax=Methylopila jiangsuensis TaxID=586230 RepID=A0A9W6JG73_9HYPH|nr:Hsp20 family protein [Methylopila jiangsuensis]MDR6286648.1 HSP20 family molecular chaperone IbpA [Methylopila jiangsuensis]GLK77010.1 heat-shock protein Hsp20 [Methylopila jiangsuensis]